MFSRLRESPWVRTGLLVVVIGFCVYGVHAEWPQAETALDRLHWYSVAGAAVASIAGAACFMLAWRALLSDLGSRLPVPAAIRTMFVAQLAKYLPGAVWAFAAQVEIGNDYRVPRSRSATSVVTALAVTLGTGLLAAAITLLAAPRTFAISVELAKKCRQLAIKAHPTVLAGNKQGSAQAQRDYYLACIDKGGNVDAGDTGESKK